MLYNIGTIQRLIVRCNMVSVETMTHRNIHVAAQQAGGQAGPHTIYGNPPYDLWEPPHTIYEKTPYDL